MTSQKGVLSFTYNAFFVPLFLLIALSICNDSSANCTNNNFPTQSIKPSTISKIIDGDTLHLTDGRKIRLIGINSPEIHYDGTPSEPFAQAARRKLMTLLKNNRAYIDVGQQAHDRYGRTLAHVYDTDGQSVEAALLRQGLAFHIAIPPNLAMSECFAKAEKIAQKNDLGVWSKNGVKISAAAQVHEGGFQYVKGRVTRISFTKSAWWLSLDNHVALVIYAKNQHRFQRDRIKELKGKVIEIRGWIYPSHSKKYEPWRMKIETPYHF
jgi:endonuclease YncB( thermonuclease family)